MMKNTTISERIIQITDYLGITTNDFAKKLGYKRSQAIYDVISGKSKPSFDFFDKINNSEYSELFNYEWLITGNGNMLKGSASISTPVNETMRSVNEMFLQEKIDLLTERIADKDDKIAYQAKEILRLEKENKELRATIHDKSNPGGSVEFLDSPPIDPELKKRPQRQLNK